MKNSILLLSCIFEATVSIHMHIWFQTIMKCITHLCMHTFQTQNLWFWPKRPPSAFSMAETSVAETSVAEISRPKRPRPKCPWPKCPSTCTREVTMSSTTVSINVLKFRTLFSFFSQIKCWFSCWNSKKFCQNTKQGRPWSDCLFRSSLIWVCTVCLG